jgi:hypothetical protein
MVIAMQRIGIIVERYPRANPLIILIADPALQASASFCTGLTLKLYYV